MAPVSRPVLWSPTGLETGATNIRVETASWADAPMDPLTQYLVLFLVTALAAYQVMVIRFAVLRVEQKVNHLVARLGIDPLAPVPLSDAVKELLRDPGRKVEAIKAHREATGLGLVEARAAVEAYLNSRDE